MFICIALIIISIVSFVLWSKHGKDYNKKCKTVEFYPPEDLDSAQIGYIYGEKSNIVKLITWKRNTISIFLEPKNFWKKLRVNQRAGDCYEN